MKTEIKREELKQIYDIACETWKPKIAKYGAEDPFSDTIKFTEKQVNEMISACTAEQLPIVSKVFDVKDITSQINNFKDALEYLGEKDEEVRIYRKLLKTGIEGRVLYQQMAVCWTRALNEKHIFSEKDRKYYIWWDLYPFGLISVISLVSYSNVPLALCFKNEKIARFAANNEEFRGICEKFIK